MRWRAECSRSSGRAGGSSARWAVPEIALLRRAIRDELGERGFAMPGDDPAWYPTTEEFTRLYSVAGFVDIQAERIERPTDLPAGIADWVRTFRSGLFDMVMVPEWERDEIAAAIENAWLGRPAQSDGIYVADYVGCDLDARPG